MFKQLGIGSLVFALFGGVAHKADAITPAQAAALAFSAGQPAIATMPFNLEEEVAKVMESPLIPNWDYLTQSVDVTKYAWQRSTYQNIINQSKNAHAFNQETIIGPHPITGKPNLTIRYVSGYISENVFGDDEDIVMVTDTAWKNDANILTILPGTIVIVNPSVSGTTYFNNISHINARGTNNLPIVICGAEGTSADYDGGINSGIIDHTLLTDSRIFLVEENTLVSRSVITNHAETGINNPGTIIGCYFGSAQNETIDIGSNNRAANIQYSAFENPLGCSIVIADGTNTINICNNWFQGTTSPLQRQQIYMFCDNAQPNLIIKGNNFIDITRGSIANESPVPIEITAGSNYFGTRSTPYTEQEIESTLTNPNRIRYTQNPSPDSDLDGILDIYEVPNDPDYTPWSTGSDPHIMDTDNDRIIDGLEVHGIENFCTHNINPYLIAPSISNTTNPAMKDSDEDGQDDYTEIKQGTDPNNRESRMPVTTTVGLGLTAILTSLTAARVLAYRNDGMNQK